MANNSKNKNQKLTANAVIKNDAYYLALGDKTINEITDSEFKEYLNYYSNNNNNNNNKIGRENNGK